MSKCDPCPQRGPQNVGGMSTKIRKSPCKGLSMASLMTDRVMARSQKLRMARLVHLCLNLVDSGEPLNILE